MSFWQRLACAFGAGAIINENSAGFHGETNSVKQECDHE